VFWYREPQQEVFVMTKTKKNAVKTQAPEAPNPKTALVEVTEEDLELSDLLAVVQVQQTVKLQPSYSDPNRYPLNMARPVSAAIARYREFAPANATERHLASLSVGLQIAAMTSLKHAANSDVLLVRSEEIKNATMTARTVMDLLEALERSRGQGKQSVAVGQVTVETGGQAIVGNVSSQPRHSPKREEAENPSNDASPNEKKATRLKARKGGSRQI
jgi:hypothetical protein